MIAKANRARSVRSAVRRPPPAAPGRRPPCRCGHDLDASLDYDAGWRQRFFEADRLGRCRPVARPVFHHVAEAVFGIDGALARLGSGRAVAIYLQAGGIGVVLGQPTRPSPPPQVAPPAGPPGRCRDRLGAGGTGRDGEDGGDGDDGDPGGDRGRRAGARPPRPVNAADLVAALGAGPRRILRPDPQAWPTATTCG